MKGRLVSFHSKDDEGAGDSPLSGSSDCDHCSVGDAGSDWSQWRCTFNRRRLCFLIVRQTTAWHHLCFLWFWLHYCTGADTVRQRVPCATAQPEVQSINQIFICIACILYIVVLRYVWYTLILISDVLKYKASTRFKVLCLSWTVQNLSLTSLWRSHSITYFDRCSTFLHVLQSGAEEPEDFKPLH